MTLKDKNLHHQLNYIEQEKNITTKSFILFHKAMNDEIKRYLKLVSAINKKIDGTAYESEIYDEMINDIIGKLVKQIELVNELQDKFLTFDSSLNICRASKKEHTTKQFFSEIIGHVKLIYPEYDVNKLYHYVFCSDIPGIHWIDNKKYDTLKYSLAFLVSDLISHNPEKVINMISFISEDCDLVIAFLQSDSFKSGDLVQDYLKNKNFIPISANLITDYQESNIHSFFDDAKLSIMMVIVNSLISGCSFFCSFETILSNSDIELIIKIPLQ